MDATKQQSMHYKEKSPAETVNCIKDILTLNGIVVEEIWKDKEEVVDTYSVRINIKGTNIGTNGKGVTEEYAQASGYAEFVERYQTGILMKKDTLEKEESYTDIDEILKTSEDIVKENGAYIQEYFKEKNAQNLSNDEKAQLFRNIEIYEKMVYEAENLFVTVPFYNVRTKKLEYLPKRVYLRCYGSNGMCAGNTKAEALVQGLAEIFERVAQKRVFEEKKGLPDIPETYIQKYPYVYKMFRQIKEAGKYGVHLKDCSFGGEYPVVALIISEKNTGKYGVRFGCHPDYGVAMERTFTEATQGQNIQSFARMNYVDFTNHNVSEWDNVSNSFKVGLAQYPYQFLLNSPSYEFKEPMDVSTKSNEQILHEWLQKIIWEGKNILIREMSILGFPTFQIIIPGLSELKPMTIEYAKLYNTKIFSTIKLKNLQTVSREDCGYIALAVRKFKDCILENNIESYLPFASATHLPGEDIKKGTEYLAVLCHLMRKEYDKAEFYARRICSAYNYDEISEERKHLYTAILLYCQAMQILNSHEETVCYLRELYDKCVCAKIDYLLGNPEQILTRQYGDIQNNNFSSMEETKSYHLTKLSILGQLNPINQQDLEKLLVSTN